MVKKYLSDIKLRELTEIETLLQKLAIIKLKPKETVF